MKEEAHTLSTAYFRAVYTRAILLLHAACEKLTMCSLSDTLCAHSVTLFLLYRLLGVTSHGEEQKGVVANWGLWLETDGGKRLQTLLRS